MKVNRKYTVIMLALLLVLGGAIYYVEEIKEDKCDEKVIREHIIPPLFEDVKYTDSEINQMVKEIKIAEGCI